MIDASTTATHKIELRGLPAEFMCYWFRRLRGFEPYPWQVALFHCILEHTVPNLVYIPTGGGKTDLITAWFLAVCFQIQQARTPSISRRVYFAVDRRNIVDQAEAHTYELRQRIEGTELLDVLRQATTADNPLVVSVMRGQRVTEQEPLVADPSAFGIILCTPDMVLSRLLFSAYGSSPRVASREAGLVGQDAWVVLDEAHLSDAGRNTLEFVQSFNRSGKWWHTCMTATPRSGNGANTLTLSDKDLSQMTAKLKAHKCVKILDVEEKNVVANVLSAIAQHSKPWSRLIVYVEKPKHADAIAAALSKELDVQLLTGTMRGLEKNRLNFAPFKTSEPKQKSALICTSAGEVGFDVSADLLVTEFNYLERLMQRLGRLNRWAESNQAWGYIIKTNDEKKNDGKEKKSLKETYDYLKSLPVLGGWTDVSTFTLYQCPAPAEAFSPTPDALSLNEVILAQLANTSIDHSVPVELYIRGFQAEYQVNMVIRNDAELAALAGMSTADLRDYVARVPVLSHEIFKEAIDNHLLAELRRVLADRKTLFVSATGEPEVLNANALTFYKLRGGTLYLPWGTINERGIFEVGGAGQGDVFDQVEEREYRRFVRANDGYVCLDSGERFEAATKRDFVRTVNESTGIPEGHKAKVIFDANGLVYVKFVPRSHRTSMLLSDHSLMATSIAEQIVAALGLGWEEAESIVEAIRHHDDGKAHPLWQTALRGSADGEPLAKSPYFVNPRVLSGMRHELVSVLMNDRKLDDLAAWLIASHHGRCRPFFPERAFDHDRLSESAELNARLPFMLEQLQREYGYWGLAYLEAVVRGIDIQAEEEA